MEGLPPPLCKGRGTALAVEGLLPPLCKGRGTALAVEGLLPPLCKGRGTALAVEGLLYRNIYILTYTGKVSAHFIVWNS